jgi:hypothetical protein
MNMLSGIPVIVDHNLPYFKWVQVRFPRSKKVRIRKKWSKQNKNFGAKPLENPIWIIGGRAHMHPATLERLKRKIELENLDI